MVRIDREKAWLATVEHLASHPDESPVFTQAVGSTFFPLTIKPAASGKLLNAPANRQSAAIAIRRLLNDEDCLVSSRVAIGLRALPESELATLLPLIYEKAQQGSLGNVMFSNKLQTSCAEVLTKLKLQEGVETSAQLLADTSWGKHNRMPQAAKLLKSFGGHAKKYQPMLREAVETLNGDGNAKWRELINDTIRLIEEAPEVTGKLPSLQSR